MIRTYGAKEIENIGGGERCIRRAKLTPMVRLETAPTGLGTAKLALMVRFPNRTCRVVGSLNYTISPISIPRASKVNARRGRSPKSGRKYPAPAGDR